MTSPTVAVVTPVFNGVAHLLPTLRSVRRQTLPPVCHIVVDDGSTDGTADLARAEAVADPRLVFLQQRNSGLSIARNTGLSHARRHAEMVMFLDDDDVLRPLALERLAAALAANPDAVAAHGAVAAIDGDGRRVPLVRSEAAARRHVLEPQRFWTSRRDVVELDPMASTDFDAFAYVLFVYTVGQVLFRRSLLDLVGGFDPVLKVAQDYDMWLRISAIGPLAYVPEVLLDYRQVERSLSSDQGLTRREDLYARFKAITDRNTSAARRRAARDLHRQHEWHRAADRLDYARASVRSRDVRAATMEIARAVRSGVEAVAAAAPWSWPYQRRIARFRRSVDAR